MSDLDPQRLILARLEVALKEAAKLVGELNALKAPQAPRSDSVPALAPKGIQIPKTAPRAKPGPANAIGGLDQEFLERCKARFLAVIHPDQYWAWWRYAIDQSWIIPSGESLADADAARIFQGAKAKEEIIECVNRHTRAVAAFMESCSVDLRNELLHAAVPLPSSEEPKSKTPPVTPGPLPTQGHGGPTP